MSSNLPPSGPPGDPSAEVLEQGRGGPLPREASTGLGSGLRKGLFIGGAVLGATAIGVGAWAAYSFMSTGPQPAEALPAGTLAYLSVDLDPSGGQKVEALRTLNKFPAFEDEVGIGADDNIQKSLVEKVLEGAPCDDLSYADDFEPWLGDRAAVAAADLGGEDPGIVVVVQVKDAAAAEKGLAAIQDCGGDTIAGGGDSNGGWVIDGDWAVISETEQIASNVSDATQEGSLADDEDFQHWTDEAGDAGVVTLYAGPAAGDYLADNSDSLFGFPFGGTTECFSASSSSEDSGIEVESDECANEGDFPEDDVLSDEMTQKLRDFQGLAVTIRFDDGAIEVDSAGDADLMGTGLLGSGTGGDAISTLPADTGAAFGVGFREGWFADLLEWGGAAFAGTSDIDEAIEALEDDTGLALPEDAETLLGESAVLAIGNDLDPDALFGSDDGSDVPVALKVKGDPEEVEAVLEKLRAQAYGDELLVFESDAEGDVIVIGPNADYREHVLGDGDLGDDEVFQDVVREVDDADVVFFVNVNELEDVIEEAMEGDDEFIDNLKPISGFGVTAWLNDDVAHGVLRITTD